MNRILKWHPYRVDRKVLLSKLQLDPTSLYNLTWHHVTQRTISYTEEKDMQSSVWQPEYAAQKLVKLKDFQLVKIYTFDIEFVETGETFDEVSQSYENSKYS